MAEEKQEKQIKTPDPNETLEVTLMPSDAIVSKRIYSNFVMVTHSPHDFSLRFCDASPIYDIDKVAANNSIHPAPVVAEIVIPFDVMPNLIKVMQTQYEKYLKGSKGDEDEDEEVSK